MPHIKWYLPTGGKKKTINSSKIYQNSWEMDGSAQQNLSSKKAKIATTITRHMSSMQLSHIDHGHMMETADIEHFNQC